MANIIDNIGTIIVSIAALIAAFFVLRAEIRKYLSQNRRDVIITLSKSELKNLLNESFDLTNKMAELTEKKISINWEMKHISEKLIEKQKMKIRQFSGISETKIKNKFSSEFMMELQKNQINPLLDIVEKESEEVIFTSKTFLTLEYNSIAFINQSFGNALNISILNLKIKLYDLCQENHFLAKGEMEWRKFLEDTSEAYAIDTNDMLKTLFPIHSNFDNYKFFELKLLEELKDLVIQSLNEAKKLSKQIEEEKVYMLEKKEEFSQEIYEIQKRKNDAIIDRYVKSQK